ncbi:MAG TPA: hypothetical protein P5531_10650 [Bacteroidales bacterium]|nr:hypothetical protein [Bacteroidales bacterium]HSA43579.1 hypothetical protein [Bacteroidales bacterium]
MRRGRSEHLISIRNRALCARYYYWTEVWERRYEKVLETLMNDEFFISEVTIQREIMRSDYLSELLNTRPKISELKVMFPGFSWVENTQFKTSKRQLSLELTT